MKKGRAFYARRHESGFCVQELVRGSKNKGLMEKRGMGRRQRKRPRVDVESSG